MKGQETVLFLCNEYLMPEWTVEALLGSPVVLVNNYRPTDNYFLLIFLLLPLQGSVSPFE